MVGAEHPGMGRRSQSLAQLERDAALQRVSRARRWLILATGALSAAFAALVSAIAPGHSLNAKANAATLATGSTVTAKPSVSGSSARLKMPPLASPGDLGLQGPSSNPQPSSDPNQAPAGQSQAPVQSQPVPSQSAAPAQDPAAVAPAPQPAPAVVSGGS